MGRVSTPTCWAPAVTVAERTDRFAEFLQLLDRLLSQPVTDHRGGWYEAHGARMLPGCVQQPRVPFVVAANGPRAMALAARYGQGWGTYGPALSAHRPGEDGDVARVERWWTGLGAMVDRFDRAVVEAGRRPEQVDRYLSIDGAPVFSLSSVSVLTEGVERAAALGFTDVVLHWPRVDGVYAGRERVLEEVAARLPELQRTAPAVRPAG